MLIDDYYQLGAIDGVLTLFDTRNYGIVTSGTSDKSIFQFDADFETSKGGTILNYHKL